MSYAVSQVVPSDAGTSPPRPTTSTVYEFTCLFSHDLRKKQKRWQDGTLKYHSFNKRVMVYDERGHTVGDAHWGGDEHLMDGDEVELDRGNAIVQVGDCVGEREQDLTDVLDRRAREVEKRRQIAASKRGRGGAVASRAVSVGSSAPRGVQQHVPLSAMLQSPGPVGRAVIPQQSPFEMRRGLHSSVEPRAQSSVAKAPPARKRRSISPPEKKGHAQNLFGARLNLSAGPPPELVAARMRALQERNNLQRQRLEEDERESLFVQSSPMESAPTPSKVARPAQRSAPLLQTRTPRQKTATPEPVEVSEGDEAERAEVARPAASPPKKRVKTIPKHAPLLQTRPTRQKTATPEPELSEDERPVERPKKGANPAQPRQPLLKTRRARPRTVTPEPIPPVEVSHDEQASQSPVKSPPKKKGKVAPPPQTNAFQRPKVPEAHERLSEDDNVELVEPMSVQKSKKKRPQQTDDTEARRKPTKQKKSAVAEPRRERTATKAALPVESEPSGPRAALRIRPKKRRGLLMLAESSNLSEEPTAPSLPPLRSPSPEVVRKAGPGPKLVPPVQEADVPEPIPKHQPRLQEDDEVEMDGGSIVPADGPFSSPPRLKSPSPVPQQPRHETIPSSLPALQIAPSSPERPVPQSQERGTGAPSLAIEEKQATPIQATQIEAEKDSPVASQRNGQSVHASDPASEASVADSPCRERTVSQRNDTAKSPSPAPPSPDKTGDSEDDIQLRRTIQQHKSKLAESNMSLNVDNTSESEHSPVVRRSTRQRVTRKRKQKTPEPTYDEDDSDCASEESSEVAKSPSPKGPRFSRLGRKGIRSMEIIGYGETHNKGPAPFAAGPIPQLAGWPTAGIGMPRVERNIPKGNLPKPKPAPEPIQEEPEVEQAPTEVITDLPLGPTHLGPVDVKPSVDSALRSPPAPDAAEEEMQSIKHSSPSPELSLQDIPAFGETDMDNPIPSKEDTQSGLVPQPIVETEEPELEADGPEPAVGLVADPIADSPPPARRPPALVRSSSSLSRGNSSFTTASDLAAAGRPMIANPATRGKKAARKEDAAGQAPQCLVPFEPVRPVRVQPKPASFKSAILRNAPPRVAAPAPVVASVTTTTFTTGSGGAWSKHAEDLLGMKRPNRG